MQWRKELSTCRGKDIGEREGLIRAFYTAEGVDIVDRGEWSDQSVEEPAIPTCRGKRYRRER